MELLQPTFSENHDRAANRPSIQPTNQETDRIGQLKKQPTICILGTNNRAVGHSLEARRGREPAISLPHCGKQSLQEAGHSQCWWQKVS